MLPRCVRCEYTVQKQQVSYQNTKEAAEACEAGTVFGPCDPGPKPGSMGTTSLVPDLSVPYFWEQSTSYGPVTSCIGCTVLDRCARARHNCSSCTNRKVDCGHWPWSSLLH